MSRPKRRKPPKSGIQKDGAQIIECRAHLQFVRGFECLGAAKEQGKCTGKIQAHHVKSRGAGGGDEQVVPLCVYHHEAVHRGRKTFEARHGVSQEKIAADIARGSMHLQKLRRAREGTVK